MGPTAPGGGGTEYPVRVVGASSARSPDPRSSIPSTVPPVELEQDERDLIDALKRGDEQAFEQLVRDHAGYLLTVARRFMPNEEDAQDAVQEAFLAAFKSIGNFEAASRLRTWLHRVVVNACLMRLRSKSRRPERSIEDLLPRFDGEGHRHDLAPVWNLSPSEASDRAETRALIQQAIGELPEDYRTVLLLRDIEGLNTQAAAEVLNITPGAVKIRLHRARLALRELLDAHFRGEAA